ncbi:MAG TPA: aldehyde dehydrogenase family protein [Thermoanaerobaculia bacterium]|jgi:acyl-CoA reductase-like NAD-dependent aldehyde dehydrogenase|nr:aldehyde dehydrogenase family protein [Thermoanaerobaculia bacterium]
MTRLNVRKTYKLYINGEFPRTESGRSYAVTGKGGELLANACRGSRKDLRNAVAAARKAQSGWSGKTAYNRGQILYRIAEVCESRAAELADELRQQGSTAAEAKKEVESVIDRWVYYAGWSDKYTQLFGTVNPVAGPYYNFTIPEPTGVVGVIAPELPALLGLVSRIAPALVGGNTVVAVTSESRPLAAITLGEIFQTSDVPGGVINLISGIKSELVPWLAAHMDVNAIDTTGVATEAIEGVQKAAAENVKRVVHFDGAGIGWSDGRRSQGPYAIFDFQEAKTVWHPIGM